MFGLIGKWNCCVLCHFSCQALGGRLYTDSDWAKKLSVSPFVISAGKTEWSTLQMHFLMWSLRVNEGLLSGLAGRSALNVVCLTGCWLVIRRSTSGVMVSSARDKHHVKHPVIFTFTSTLLANKLALYSWGRLNKLSHYVRLWSWPSNSYSRGNQSYFTQIRPVYVFMQLTWKSSVLNKKYNK